MPDPGRTQNAFLGDTFTDRTGKERSWFEMYLPQAFALYEANGGDAGWAGEACFGPIGANSIAGKRA